MDRPEKNCEDAQETARIRVAVIGTGLAGLTSVYLLHHDRLKRYSVEVFEKVCN